MSGTLPTLSLGQQLDSNGRLMIGGKLYFYAANTSTPQSAYQDTGLTIAHPRPIVLDANGRCPSFYLADGSVRARLENSSGVPQFDEAALLVIGPSSGGGGGGSSVDATTIFQTGDTLWLDQQGTRDGWVRDNGRTIGSVTSGGTERASADTQALFLFLWGAYSDTVCPVPGGRGVTAAADWAANKTITLPDKRGYVPGGLDDMGNTAAARWTGVPVVSGNVTTAGSILGEATHTLLEAETPVISKTPTGTWGGQNLAHANGQGANNETIVGVGSTAVAMNAITWGGGGVHNNAQKTVLGTFFRKL